MRLYFERILDGEQYALKGFAKSSRFNKIVDDPTISDTNLIIPNEYCDYPVTQINDYALNGCDSLMSVIIPKSVTRICESAFQDCKSLQSINIPKNVEFIGRSAFYNCTSLTSVTIPKNVEFIADSAFRGCSALADVYYNGTAKQFYQLTRSAAISPDATIHCGDGITMKMGEMAQYFAIPTNRTPSEGLEYTLNDDGASYSVTGIGTCTDTDVILPATYNNKPVTSIGDDAFRDCGFQHIALGNNIVSIGKGAFAYCTSLTDINLPDNITSINDKTFWRCDSLVNVSFPDSVTIIGDNAFRGCKSLTGIAIPKNVVHIGDSAFAHCNELYRIDIPDSVIGIGDTAFFSCEHLREVSIGCGVTSIGDDVFASCEELKDVHYHGTSSQFNSIAQYADIPWGVNTHFSIRDDELPSSGLVLSGGLVLKEDETGYYVAGRGSCDSVDIVIPATHQERPVTGIGDWAFYSDPSLQSINISDNITSIGDYAFYDCTSLKTVTISSSVTDMGQDVFHDCDELQDIYYNGPARDFYKLIKGQRLSDDVELHFEDGECTVGELEEYFDRGDDPLK